MSDPYVFTGNAAETTPTVGGKKKAAPKKKATVAPKAAPKKKTAGGAFLEDVAALSVPFSLILAKQGLDALKKKRTSAPAAPPKKTTPPPKFAKPAPATKRGGSCGTGCAGKWSGGSPASAQLAKITREIDNFLSRG